MISSSACAFLRGPAFPTQMRLRVSMHGGFLNTFFWVFIFEPCVGWTPQHLGLNQLQRGAQLYRPMSSSPGIARREGEDPLIHQCDRWAGRGTVTRCRERFSPPRVLWPFLRGVITGHCSLGGVRLHSRRSQKASVSWNLDEYQTCTALPRLQSCPEIRPRCRRKRSKPGGGRTRLAVNQP